MYCTTVVWEESVITKYMTTLGIAVVSRVMVYLMQLQQIPLHHAAYEGRLESTNLLIKAGSPVNAVNSVSRCVYTPVHSI